jgi:hypothetical protein
MTMFRSVTIFALLIVRSSGTFTESQCTAPLNPPVILKYIVDPTRVPTRAPTMPPSRAPTTTGLPTNVPSMLPTCTRTTKANTKAQVDTLGSLCRYAILAEAGVTNTGSLDLTGDIGVSPITFAAIVGFGLKLDSKKAFSESAMVTGKVFAADYRGGTTTDDLATDIRAMEALYTEMSTLPATTTLTATSISGLVFTPGVYKYGGAITMAAATKVTLTGGPDDVFVIQSTGALTLGATAVIELDGGVQAKNVYWTAVGATFGAGAQFKGVLLSSTAATYGAGVVHFGHIYAQTAVTIGTGVTLTAIPC